MTSTTLLVFVSLLFSAFLWGAHGDQLEDVVTAAMSNYPKWVKDNALDPYVDPDFNSFSATTGPTIRYILAFGTLEVTGTSNLDQSQTKVEANLASRTLQVSYKLTGDVAYMGLYHINGTAFLSPFDGEGKWTAASKNGSNIVVNLVANNLTVSDDCHVVLNKFDDDYSDIVLDADMEFEGLNAGVWADIVKNMLSNGVLTIARRPMEDMMRDYLQEVFEKTTICDIVG